MTLFCSLHGIVPIWLYLKYESITQRDIRIPEFFVLIVNDSKN
jgi:hypothetical protein